jgi:hypothetical protein
MSISPSSLNLLPRILVASSCSLPTEKYPMVYCVSNFLLLARVTLVARDSSLIRNSMALPVCLCWDDLFLLEFFDLADCKSFLKDCISQSQCLWTSFKEEITSVLIKP